MSPRGDGGRQRAYPRRIVGWSEHTDAVLVYAPTDALEIPVPNTYLQCWSDRQLCGDETSERSYVKKRVLAALPFTFGQSRDGRTDDCIVNRSDRRKLVVIEEKSTQELRMPERLEAVVAAYGNSDWRTTHPIGQVARQMMLNDCPYGVITSGTRTYFVYASVGDDGAVVVSVSRRWYVGEPHYLRAWAWLVHKANADDPLQKDALRGTNGGGWRKFKKDDTTDSPQPDKQRPANTRGGGGGVGDERPSKKNKAEEGAAAANNDDEPWERPNTLGVLEIDCGDVDLFWDRRLGYGRNGPVVEGCWDGRRIAVKQFDLDHGDGPHFQRELEAYAALRHLQGTAVARLLFVSRSWCGTLRLMGLELGEQVKGDEPKLRSELRRVHAALSTAGWLQDVEENKLENHVWQADGKLVAIDLELLERRPAGRNERT